MLGLPGLFFKKKTANFNVQYLPEVTQNSDLDNQGNEFAQNTTGPSAKSKEIAADEKTQINMTVAGTDEAGTSQPSSQQLLFVIRRAHGRELRQQLETNTGLSAELNSIAE